MQTFVRIVLFLFAALLILGGIAGYLEKKSVISLLAGFLCGGLGLTAGLLLPQRPSLALILGLVGAFLAIGGMMPRLKNKETGEIKVWPAGIVVAFSALTLVTTAAALVMNKGAVPPPPPGS